MAVSQILGTLRAPKNLSISQWADAKRYLSPESSAEPGKYYTERAEYCRGIMDALSDPTVKEIDVMTSSQIGKSTLLENFIGYFIDQDPAPILLIQPTLEMAKVFSTEPVGPHASKYPLP